MVHLLLRGLLLLLRRGGGQERRHKEHKTHASHPGPATAAWTCCDLATCLRGCYYELVRV
jgi:hypothetical protein